jgi:hypothetical protein
MDGSWAAPFISPRCGSDVAANLGSRGVAPGYGIAHLRCYDGLRPKPSFQKAGSIPPWTSLRLSIPRQNIDVRTRPRIELYAKAFFGARRPTPLGHRSHDSDLTDDRNGSTPRARNCLHSGFGSPSLDYQVAGRGRVGDGTIFDFRAIGMAACCKPVKAVLASAALLAGAVLPAFAGETGWVNQQVVLRDGVAPHFEGQTERDARGIGSSSAGDE